MTFGGRRCASPSTAWTASASMACPTWAASAAIPADLVAATIGPDHGYPDGLVLYLGTMFAPVADRDAPGRASRTTRVTS